MALQTFKAGARLHTAENEMVETLQILVQGHVRIDNGIVTLNAGTGAILGLAEIPGTPYRFSYIVMEDAQIIPYPYTTADDIAAVIKTHAKICPVLASENIRLVCEALNVRALMMHTDEFRAAIFSFRENQSRYASTDEARMARRAVGRLFYEIYTSAFLRSMVQQEDIPAA